MSKPETATCPTCGGAVRVIGDTTLHYKPKHKHPDLDAAERRIAELETLHRRVKDALMQDAGKHSHKPGAEDPRVNEALNAAIEALDAAKGTGR